VKLVPAFTSQLKAVHRAACVACRGCEQYVSSGINHNRPVAHACGGNRQDILRSRTDPGYRLIRSVTEEAPHFEGVEVATEFCSHPMMQWPARARDRARIHIKKQAADFLAAEVEPHQVLPHLFPPVKKNQ
jgi:hypothetical protein